MNRDWLRKVERFKYPLLILCVGVLLLTVPGSQKDARQESPDVALCTVLETARGVGRAHVLISEHGVVIICEGADDAAVQLDIIRAIGSYTGFGSDKITILKLEEHGTGRKES